MERREGRGSHLTLQRPYGGQEEVYKVVCGNHTPLMAV